MCETLCKVAHIFLWTLICVWHLWLWCFAALPQQHKHCTWKQTGSGYTSVRGTIGWVTAGISYSHTNFSLSESVQTPATSTTGGSLWGTQTDDTPALCVVYTLLAVRLKQPLSLAYVWHSNGVQTWEWVHINTGTPGEYEAHLHLTIKVVFSLQWNPHKQTAMSFTTDKKLFVSLSLTIHFDAQYV